jgi:hypothetical protein
MSDGYLDNLEENAIEAVKILESERYTEFSWGIMELVRQCKHYQQISESVLSAHCGMDLEKNEAEVQRARENRDWYRHGDENGD